MNWIRALVAVHRAPSRLPGVMGGGLGGAVASGAGGAALTHIALAACPAPRTIHRPSPGAALAPFGGLQSGSECPAGPQVGLATCCVTWGIRSPL